MPLGQGTVSGQAGRDLKIAARSVLGRGGDPDCDFTLAELPKIKLTSHSLRRLTTTVVKEWLRKHGFSQSEADAKMGWKEAERKADMNDHYDEFQLRRRIEMGQSTIDM